MKVIKNEEAEKFVHSENCVVYEYDFHDKDIDCGMAIIDGRYPASGYIVNDKCKELVYVISGFGKLITKTDTVEFKEGDSILLDTKEEYFWDAHCKVLMPCTPAWYPEQYRKID